MSSAPDQNIISGKSNRGRMQIFCNRRIRPIELTFDYTRIHIFAKLVTIDSYCHQLQLWFYHFAHNWKFWEKIKFQLSKPVKNYSCEQLILLSKQTIFIPFLHFTWRLACTLWNLLLNFGFWWKFHAKLDLFKTLHLPYML